MRASGILGCNLWLLEFSREFQQLLHKVSVTVHKGHFPNVGAYSPINRVFFCRMWSKFKFRKVTSSLNLELTLWMYEQIIMEWRVKMDLSMF